MDYGTVFGLGSVIGSQHRSISVVDDVTAGLLSLLFSPNLLGSCIFIAGQFTCLDNFLKAILALRHSCT